ncbi:hypothetical protein [Sorangium sp. So ce1153]|uniref:hypothetical protein n=1 Tax=Sorangium sp. So ce1153 TaxID=3133333 RepID=UPI003F5F3C6A
MFNFEHYPGEPDAGGGEERAELRLGALPATAGDQHLEIEELAEVGTGGTSGIATGAPLQVDGGPRAA